MRKRTIALLAGAGCLVIILFLVAAGFLLWRFVGMAQAAYGSTVLPTVMVQQLQPTAPVLQRPTRVSQAPAVTPVPLPAAAPLTGLPSGGTVPSSELLSALYDRLNPGVVNIQVVTATGGGTGSGYLVDNDGHIVTNNHVVADAQSVTVVYYNGHEATAEVVGTDDDSDVAVIHVQDVPESVHPVPLGDSDTVQVGEWVMAIGSPFGLGSTFTLGIVSARGRTIPSGVTPFSIPEAIQTDAAINPGNSGGPLLNLRGEVIGMNAQIASSGVGANAGVGFAIPVNVVKRVAPAIIEQGYYEWPWLGVSGTSVTLILQRANNLDQQTGAYIADVSTGGPAETAGLHGSTSVAAVDGQQVPVGGDVVIAIDGATVENFNDLLRMVASHEPGDRVVLTILRDGRQQTVDVVLEARPQTFGQ